MEQIRIVCWFINSEEFVAKLVLQQGIKCIIQKIIDPMAIITGRMQNMLSGEKYDFYGKSEEISKLKKFLNDSDFDVEVIEQG